MYHTLTLSKRNIRTVLIIIIVLLPNFFFNIYEAVLVIDEKISVGEEYFFKPYILIFLKDIMCLYIIHTLGYILINK